MIKIQKYNESDLDRVESLINQSEKEFSRYLMAQTKSLKSQEKIERIRQLVEQGRYDLALQEIEEDESNFLLFAFKVWIAASTLQIAISSDAMKRLQTSLFGTSKPITFNPIDPSNIANLRNVVSESTSLLRELRRNGFLFALNEGLNRGLSGKDLVSFATRFQGLSQAQIKATLNYERLLRENSKQTLERVLRNSSFDDRILLNRPLTEKQIQKMVDSYISNQLVFGIQNLSRLVVGDLINEAMQESAKKSAEDSGIGTSRLVKTWRSMRDKKVRVTHKQHVGLDGQVVGINEYFVSPSGARLKHPRDRSAPLKETVNCRCYLLVYYLEG